MEAKRRCLSETLDVEDKTEMPECALFSWVCVLMTCSSSVPCSLRSEMARAGVG